MITPEHDCTVNYAAERAAIGCAIQDPSLAPELKPDWFHDLRHRDIAETIVRMASENKQIDLATVGAEMRGRPVEMVSLVVECHEAAYAASSFGFWRNQLLAARMRRELIKIAARLNQSARDGTVAEGDLLADAERDVLAVRGTVAGVSGDEVDAKETIRELISDYEQARDEGKPMGIETGYRDIDRLLGGLKPQQLILIAARPSVGKTALALNIAERIAVNDRIPVAFFSLEMSGKELIHRLSCSIGRVDGSKLNDGTAKDPEVHKLTAAHDKIMKAPLKICDRGGLTVAQLTGLARRFVQKHGIRVIAVDYLGLLRSGEKGRSRYEEVTAISGSLKMLAKELNLPVIALAQLNRETEKDNRPPRMSDLRDSGSIEQDADAILLLHRSDEGTKVIVAKNRNGRCGLVSLNFIGEYTRFESVSS